MCSLVFVICISLCVQYMPNGYGSPILEEAAGISLPLPVGDPEPPIPLNGNGADVIRLEEHSNDSIPPEIMVDATNPAEVGEVGEDGSDLKTDATGYYGYGYSRYRPSLYNYYGNPYYNYRYNGNYYQPQTAQYPQYPQYPQYYYPRNNYYYSNYYNPYRSQYRFGGSPYYY